MSVYWVLLLIAMLIALSPRAKESLLTLQWFIYGFILVVLVGLRYQVGGDWENYIQNYTWVSNTPFLDILKFSVFSSHDLGYEALYWVSLHYLDGIYATNTVCALIFVAGLLRLCRRMPMPWMALYAAIPYLVIVVAMGYTRQAVAIGFAMWGLVDLMDRKALRFYLAVLCGALFHKTALLLIPVGFLYVHSAFNFRNLMLYGFLFSGGYIIYSSAWFQYRFYHYVVHAEMQSSGAFIRVMMNVSAGVVFLLFQKKWSKVFGDEGLWRIFSVSSLAMLPPAFASSTIVDRLALYFIPLQLVVFSRVPVLMKSTYHRTIAVVAILCYYAGVLFVWLKYGSYSAYWLPYKNVLF